MFALGPRLTTEEKSALRERYEMKRSYIREHLHHLRLTTSPTNLWNSIVNHRASEAPKTDATTSSTSADPGDSEAAVDSYDELRLTFDGFRAVAYELLFGATVKENEASPLPIQEERKSLFFSHPFLSPATFLSFARSDNGTVPAVPLYAFVAKRLLLYRLRVELELVASVPPSVFLAQPPRGVPAPLNTSSPLSNGLTQEDLEKFIGDLVPHLRLVRDIPPWMLPYYLCHASRKFFFMCDNHHVGVISIETVMKSEVFSELLRLFESDPQDAFSTFPEKCPVEVSARFVDPSAAPDETIPGSVVSYENDGMDASDLYTVEILPAAVSLTEAEEGGDNRPATKTVNVRRDEVFFNSAAAECLDLEQLNMDNWFSLPLMCRIYEHFTSLDQDEDGVLTIDELAHYSNDSFTRLAIERTFECHVPHSGSKHIMDYKTYMNFVIATEHAATRPAMKYIWAILDLDEAKTQIKMSTLQCFCKEIAKELVNHGLMVEISAQSILAEIIDMINPAWHEYVTFEDVERSGQQATVLPILLSYRNFFAYDCREQTAAVSGDEYTESCS